MAAIDPSNLNDYQYDILWDLLDDNPKLPYSPIKALNKQLNTSSKRVIGSINELIERLTTIGTTVSSFSTDYNNVIGNSATTPELVTNLKKIDENILKAVYKIWLELVGDGTTDISHIGPNVKAAIYELGETLSALETRMQGAEDRLALIEEMLDDIEFRGNLVLNPDTPHIFSIPFKPNTRPIILEINGIRYDEGEEFSVDREAKTLTWLATSDNGGFDIESDFEVKLWFYYEPEDN